MFEYKEGDKIKCKKFYKGEITRHNFYNGSEYIITSIYQIAGSGEPNFKSSFLSIWIAANSFDREEFYEHFYSKKELRKLKLEHIKKNV